MEGNDCTSTESSGVMSAIARNAYDALFVFIAKDGDAQEAIRNAKTEHEVAVILADITGFSPEEVIQDVTDNDGVLVADGSGVRSFQDYIGDARRGISNLKQQIEMEEGSSNWVDRNSGGTKGWEL